MKSTKVIRSLDPINEFVDRCRAFMNDWLLFGQILNAYRAPGANPAQLEAQFLLLKSKLAREYQVLKDRLGPDFSFDANTIGILAATTSLEAVYSQSDVAVKKLQNEWHRAFIAMNETLGILEEKKTRAQAGERIEVGGLLLHVRRRKPLPMRQIGMASGAVLAVILVVGGLYFMRHFLGFWAPHAGENIVVSDTMTDEEKIRGLLDTLKQAVENEDVDRMMTTYSDHFKDPEGRGKTELRLFVQSYKTSGQLKNVHVDAGQAKLAIENDEARAGPIFLADDGGQVSINLVLGREGKGWLITSIEGL